MTPSERRDFRSEGLLAVIPAERREALLARHPERDRVARTMEATGEGTPRALESLLWDELDHGDALLRIGGHIGPGLRFSERSPVSFMGRRLVAEKFRNWLRAAQRLPTYWVEALCLEIPQVRALCLGIGKEAVIRGGTSVAERELVAMLDPLGRDLARAVYHSVGTRSGVTRRRAARSLWAAYCEMRRNHRRERLLELLGRRVLATDWMALDASRRRSASDIQFTNLSSVLDETERLALDGGDEDLEGLGQMIKEGLRAV